ncbi:carboxypeptidase-like regulatory domain-containing protein [Flagellimonas zhangzhouensis]|uniref:CarboxypepD_reg-like domain-containing protein n=1 Tax=Flagellimonas zhangzhouensis TaxID=1073328 RepID=A0A1H2Y0W2_9FLAO|nr:carboxypeptidase-like regulatory domain-containing protein [Allomuricauda zhangzhouensis]SDQ94217.1 CarboxypepD_reg-like domain-containing protein [Allomuricauda zhangzhouensis]SDW98843.1 CarboxypepD_reg-like domain-containing protein [Allomuricauda zhangzhouensis]
MKLSNPTIKKTQIIRNALFICATFLFFGINQSLAFQEQPGVDFDEYRGEVVDAESNKALVFATLTVEGTNISTITNTEGNFLLKIPKNINSSNVIVSFLGYKTTSVPISSLEKEGNKISLMVSVTQLSEININAPKDAKALVRATMAKRDDNYFNDPSLMTAFYRETIKKRRKNVSLAEAVVNIYKTPYTSTKDDAVELYKARKSTDYTKLDTVALKLQGGPYNTLYVDIMKYPEYIFSSEAIDDYKFTFDRSTRINDKLIYVIRFNQLEHILEPLYQGELYIDVENNTLTNATFTLNIIDREKAAKLFVRRKPARVDVWPTEVSYRVDYREKNEKWYYGYSSVFMEFKVDWQGKLFNSTYSMNAEMAITDWELNATGDLPRYRERIKRSIILSDEATGFSDPSFWGEYNIIEPEQSIESAIRKIQRQLRRTERNSD